MCNTCNSSVFSSNGNGCGCNSCCCNSCNNGGTYVFQRICRDCNGNIVVSNSGGCGCNSCCHCGCQCGCTNGNARSGDIRLVTVCGNSGNTDNGRQSSGCAYSATATSEIDDAYYARQYALNGRNNRSLCGCGCNG